MADEVETLKRELEALKLQLEMERKTSAAVQGGIDSPKQLTGQLPPHDESPKQKRRGGDVKASAAPKEPRIYVQHAAVGTRRGKWWLRDRQVLSRATPEEGGATLKLRETWVWSGRSVILDKIVRIEREEEGAQEGGAMEEDDAMEEEASVTGGVVEGPAARAASPRNAATVSREAQESRAAETSRAATTTGEEAVASKAVVEEEDLTPQKSAKADDEVRESSVPVQPDPPVTSDSM